MKPFFYLLISSFKIMSKYAIFPKLAFTSIKLTSYQIKLKLNSKSALTIILSQAKIRFLYLDSTH